MQERVQLFWEKWLLLYISHLQKRHKQTVKQRNLQVGDLVLITDRLTARLTARSQYSLARVIEVHPDKTGAVRNVTVITADQNKLKLDMQPERKTLQRDTTKLALTE